MGIDHFLRQLRDGELESESSEDEPEEEEEPQGKISRFHAIFWFMIKNDQKLSSGFCQKLSEVQSLYVKLPDSF